MAPRLSIALPLQLADFSGFAFSAIGAPRHGSCGLAPPSPNLRLPLMRLKGEMTRRATTRPGTVEQWGAIVEQTRRRHVLRPLRIASEARLRSDLPYIGEYHAHSA